MRFAHPYYFSPVDVTYDSPMTIVIENAGLFRNVISEIINQCDGYDGNFVVSENNELLEFSKNCILISDVFKLDFMKRDIKSRIQKILEMEMINEDSTNELISSIEQYAGNVSENFNYPLKFKMDLLPTDIIKMLNFEIDEADSGPLEKLVDYLDIYSNLLAKRLIIIVNMKDILTGEEYKEISEDLQNRQINLMMIERHTHDFDDCNHRLIIDEDLCEI